MRFGFRKEFFAFALTNAFVMTQYQQQLADFLQVINVINGPNAFVLYVNIYLFEYKCQCRTRISIIKSPGIIFSIALAFSSSFSIMFSKSINCRCLLYIGLTILAISSVASYGQKKLDWCDRALCPNGKWHVACNHNGRFGDNCPEDAIMYDLRPHREHILHEHNTRRNFVALGQLPGYYPAARMATMVWDEELAYLASLNIKMCYVEHDECNNSYRFKSVGQNLSGVDRRRDLDANVSDIIAMSMGLWFGEYPLIDSSYIRSFRVSSNFEKYGHFAEMMIDRNTHVGCAMSRYTHPDYPFLYIYNTACNYASKYALETPVYRVGEPASECETGPNPNYPGLCSKREKFNPNYD